LTGITGVILKSKVVRGFGSVDCSAKSGRQEGKGVKNTTGKRPAEKKGATARRKRGGQGKRKKEGEQGPRKYTKQNPGGFFLTQVGVWGEHRRNERLGSRAKKPPQSRGKRLAKQGKKWRNLGKKSETSRGEQTNRYKK